MRVDIPQAAVRQLNATSREQERVLKEIKDSFAWRVTKPIRLIAKSVRRAPKP